MYEKERRSGIIRFALKPADGTRRVFLAGGFTNWRPLAMRRRRDGTFVRRVSKLGSVFEYKFTVGGQWILDPDHSDWSVSPIGTLNSVGVHTVRRHSRRDGTRPNGD